MHAGPSDGEDIRPKGRKMAMAFNQIKLRRWEKSRNAEAYFGNFQSNLGTCRKNRQ